MFTETQHENNFHAIIKSAFHYCPENHDFDFLDNLYQFMGGESIDLATVMPDDAILNYGRMMSDSKS